MSVHPVVFIWRDVDVTDEHGEVRRVKAMVPLPRYGNVASRQFAEGEEYPLVVLEERSRASHGAYFAQVNEYFDQLPEKIAARWPTADHLRYWVLIETGWYEETDFPCPDELFLKRLITHIRKNTPYARMSTIPMEKGGTRLIIRTAKSQSMAEMKKQAFEDSKKSVLDYLEHLTGIPVSTLKREAGRHS